ncbi:MAG: 50S ribosomal protein L13 [Fibrobacterota bacterium]
MKTKIATEKEILRAWKLVDADGKTLGRMASKVAVMLIGKDKPLFSPHQDHGDYVVVINAEKVHLTGKKADTKEYFRHSKTPGNWRMIPYKEKLEKAPEDIVKTAVNGMIQSKGPLGRRIKSKLFVYAGPEHPHAAQKPVAVAV